MRGESSGTLDKSTANPDGTAGPEGTSPPVFLLDGPGPFFLWALDLTEEQQEQLKIIGEKYRPEGAPQGPQGGPPNESQGPPRGRPQGGPPDQRPDENSRVGHEEQMQAMRQEMLAVLTDDQVALLVEIEAQLVNGQYPDAAVAKTVAILIEKLDLDGSQQSEMAGILKEYGDRWVALRNSEDRYEAHEAMRTLFEELDASVTAILNQDQVEAYETLKAECKPQGPRGQGPQGPPRGTGR